MSSVTHASPAVGAATRTPSTYVDLVLLVGRVLLGGIFVFSGYFKVTAVAAFAASLERRGVPFASVMGVIGAYVEFLGGLAIVLGIELRYTSVLMIGFVIVATLISHRFWELTGEARGAQQTQFLKNVGIAAGFVLLHAAGGGRLALERLWRRD